MPDHRSLAAAALLATLLAPPPARAQARPGDVGDVMAEVLELRRQVAGLHLVLRQRDEMLDGMRKELRGVGDEVQAL
jgi:Flp pilus assembly protein CpaB